MRPTQATVNLSLIQKNVQILKALAPDSLFCAVVKADAYGHGSVPVARAAIDAGADWLGVALVEEGIELRKSGVAAPIFLLNEPRPKEMIELAEFDLCPTIYSSSGLAAVAAASEMSSKELPVHLKVDTGMHRVGAQPEDIVEMAKSILAKPNLTLEGVWTHLAVADEPNNPHNQLQLKRYEEVLSSLKQESISFEFCHTANSAGLLNLTGSHYNMVRVGIAMYGILPSQESDLKLHPAMNLTSQVSFLKKVKAGESISYGLRHTFAQDALVATVPIGYADGIRRDFNSVGGQVLIREKRHPVVGTVTMDQLMVECLDDSIQPGDEVVLIGSQGKEAITADDIAAQLGTIAYEVVCDIGKRVRREYL